MLLPLSRKKSKKKNWGGPTPFMPMGKLCLFPFSPFFPMGKNYMEREGNEYFPSLSIYFFPIFPMGKNGKRHIFPWAKMGLDPSPKLLLVYLTIMRLLSISPLRNLILMYFIWSITVIYVMFL